MKSAGVDFIDRPFGALIHPKAADPLISDKAGVQAETCPWADNTPLAAPGERVRAKILGGEKKESSGNGIKRHHVAFLERGAFSQWRV